MPNTENTSDVRTRARNAGKRTTSKKKALGAPSSPAAGWTNHIADQIVEENKIVTLNVKTIPVDSINFAFGNPRALLINADDLKHGPELPSVKELNDTVWSDYEFSLRNYYSNQDHASRKIKEHISIATFAHNLGEADNLIEPIAVEQDGTEFSWLVGERRFLSHILLKETHIAARIYKAGSLSDEQKTLMQWQENKDREAQPLRADLNVVRKLVQFSETKGETLSVRKLITKLGIKHTIAQRLWKVFQSESPRIHSLINNETLSSLSTAYEVACADEELQDQLLNDIESGIYITREEVKAMRDAKTKIAEKPTTSTMSIVGDAKVSVHAGLLLKRKTNLNAVREIILSATSCIEDKHTKDCIAATDLSNKKGIESAWLTLYKYFEEAH